MIPCLVGCVEIFPLVSGTGEVIGGEHYLGGVGKKCVIGYWEVSMLGFEMSLLDRIDVIRNTGGFLVVCHHLISDIDAIHAMKSPTART